MKLGSFKVGATEVLIKEYLCEFLVKKNRRTPTALKTNTNGIKKSERSFPVLLSPVRLAIPDHNYRDNKELKIQKTNFQKMVRDLRNSGNEVKIYSSDEIRYNMNGLNKYDKGMVIVKWGLQVRKNILQTSI